MKAKIEVDVPEYQIGQEVTIYFKDTMTKQGIVEKSNDVIVEFEKIKEEIENTGAYEQEVHGKTEFLKGITYCLNIIDNRIKKLKEK